MKHKKLTDQQIFDAYAAFKVANVMAAKLGVPTNTISRHSKRLGLTFAHGGGKITPLNEILEGKHPHFNTNKLKKKLLQEGVKTNQCEECGIVDHNGKPLVMQLDHIDGNSHDHRLSNLRMLCPNCHSQTETFSGKNKIVRA